MRPSQKSGRGRGKGNRTPKSNNQGHSPNRVYDSAGPEGKVRGTPQQIVDKYQGLARDAQLSGDRVTAENFLQHAEHYVRILSAVQEAEDKRREQQQQQQNNQNHQNNSHSHNGQQGGGEQPHAGQQPNDRGGDQPEVRRDDTRRDDNRRDDNRGDDNRREANQGDGAQRDGGHRDDRQRDDRPRENRRRNNRNDAPQPVAEPIAEPIVEASLGEQPASDGLAALDAVQGGAPEIVETPEARVKPRTRRPRPKAPEKVADALVGDEAPAAVEAPAKPARKPRAPRKVVAPEPQAADDAPAAPVETPVQEAS